MQSSSSTSSKQHKETHLQHPELQSVLLRHPSIRQDKQLLRALLQTSKQLQAAVPQLLPGEWDVVLPASTPETKVKSFVRWFGKHAGLLRGLQLTLDGAFEVRLARWLQEAMQRHPAGSLQLQSFELMNWAALPGILQQLPAAHLTRLSVNVDADDSASLLAVAALTGLRSLSLGTNRNPVKAADVGPLAAGMQQLTELRMMYKVPPRHLQQLPTTLQQLEVWVDVGNDQQQQQEAAGWLKQHGSIITKLRLYVPAFDGGYGMAKALEQATVAGSTATAAGGAGRGRKRGRSSSCSNAGPVTTPAAADV
jgi:hypothetical protein